MNILNEFDSFLTEAKKSNTVFDGEAKRELKEELSRQGLPSRQDEAWRNTSLKFLNEISFLPQASRPTRLAEKVSAFLNSKKIPGAQYLVFVNGFYLAPESEFNSKDIKVTSGLSSLNKTDFSNSVKATSLNLSPAMTSLKPEDVASRLSQKLMRKLNRLYNLESLEISIDTDVVQPIQIINLTQSDIDRPQLSSPQLNLTLKANKKATIVLTHVGDSEQSYLSNSKISIKVENDAHLEIVNHVNQGPGGLHFDDIQISASKAAVMRYFEFNFNALVTRHEFAFDIEGEQVQSEILGASYLKQKQHCDSQTYINHKLGHSKSEQIYKALLDDDSHSVFVGTVHIAEGLAKADSAQLNQNLLLTDRAEVNSKPVLRIFSDDVKASHGTTMGQIHEDEIFYLQSRSISRSKAIEILGQGFLNEIVLKLESDQLKNYFTQQLLTGMRQNQSNDKRA